MRGVPRLRGVDLARLLALLGMFAAHLITPVPGDGPGGVDGLFQVVAGRSSALFAVLAGVSLALASRQVLSDPGTARRRLLVRAGLVAAIGLWLGLLGSGVAVILVYYGLLFCCALPVLTWRTSSLAWLALAWGLVSPVVSLGLRQVLPPMTGQVPSFLSLADPVQLVGELLVTGYYPVLTWATYLFAGLAVGRALAPATGGGGGAASMLLIRRIVLVGAWFAALALGVSALLTRSAAVRTVLVQTSGEPDRSALGLTLRHGFYGTHPTGSGWWLGVWAPHSGSVVDLAHTTGCALVVLGACLWLVRLLPRLPWRVLAGAGAMTLTLYTAHVVLLAGPLGQAGPLAPGSPWAPALHAALAVATGIVLALLHRPGPLEWCVREATRLVRARA